MIINFHWLIVLGLMIVTVDDVKTFAHDSYEQITYLWVLISELTLHSGLRRVS